MERKALLKLAEELSNARGVSGFEDEVLAVLRRHGGHLGELSAKWGGLLATTPGM